MKKYFFLIFIILIISGCNKSVTLNINSSNVTSIVYEGVSLISNDYETITKEINDKIFYELIDNNITGEKLEIKTIEYLYNFEIIDNYLIYTVDNIKYFTSTNNLSNILNDIVKKYTDENFFTVDFENDYDINESDYLINIDSTNNFIVINSKLNLYNFKINKVNNNFDNYVDINLLNTVDKIDSNKTILISSNDPSILHISFITPYNFKVNIYYDNKFIIDMKQISS